MRFGYQQPSHLFQKSSNVYAKLRDVALLCETEGFDSFWVMDHLTQIPWAGELDDPILEPFTAISALAEATSRIRLGVLCTCNIFRNPALLAKMGSTVDQISQGRFWLGIGAGWFKKEAEMYGYYFPKDADRLQMLEESLQIIKGAWTPKKKGMRGLFSFRGKYYSVKDLVLEPRPVQIPHPPILVGGGGERITLKLVARYADACNFFPKGKTLETKLEVLKAHCKDEGRDYSSILKTKLASVFFGNDEASALRNMMAHKPKGVTPKAYSSSALLGNTKQIVKEIEEYEKLGIQYLIINFRGSFDSAVVKRFSRQVMTSF